MLEEVVSATKFKTEYRRLKKHDKHLFLIMLFDLLIGSKKIQGGGRMKKMIFSHRNAFTTALVRLKLRKGARSDTDLIPAHLSEKSKAPRYARVNTLVTSLGSVKNVLASEGWKLVNANKEKSAAATTTGQDDSGAAAKSITILPSGVNASPEEGMFHVDSGIPNLIFFPTGTDLHDHDLVKSGKLILQDKASCFPAVALLHGQECDDWTVIDGCSAPGNKTTHVASVLHDRKGAGHVEAYELDPARFNLLNRMLGRAHATRRVSSHLGSFLETDTSPNGANQKVDAILLDPTCSGSGMQDRLEQYMRGEETADDKKRVESLAEFQLSMVNHALSFPNVMRVSYSTCSLYQEENEGVVLRALQANPSFELAQILPWWHRRGIEIPGISASQAQRCVRVLADEDYMNGFFVAVFQRKSDYDPSESSLPALSPTPSTSSPSSTSTASTTETTAETTVEDAVEEPKKSLSKTAKRKLARKRQRERERAQAVEEEQKKKKRKNA